MVSSLLLPMGSRIADNEGDGWVVWGDDQGHRLGNPAHHSPDGWPWSSSIPFFFFFCLLSFVFLLLLLLLLFLGPLPRHMEVPRLGVESEL